MSNKLAIITGGNQGIGKAIAKIFAKNNFDLLLIARNEKTLASTQSEFIQKYSIKVNIFSADLSKKSQVDDAVSFYTSLNRRVDVLVNNTGTYTPGQVHNEDDGAIEKMIETNLYSAYHLTRGLINRMIESKNGHIFNICSTASIIPYINGGSYCISKHALLGFNKVLREEMKAHGVKVTAILPGPTKTASWDGVDLPDERFIKPQDVAEAIWAAYQLSPNSVVEEILIRPQLGDI
jgi:short-subunit dehydrogenase